MSKEIYGWIGFVIALIIVIWIFHITIGWHLYETGHDIRTEVKKLEYVEISCGKYIECRCVYLDEQGEKYVVSKNKVPQCLNSGGLKNITYVKTILANNILKFN